MKGDTDADALIVLGQDVVPQHCGHQGCDALLSVNENLLALRTRAILQPYRIPPGNQVAYRIPLVQGVH